jgi:hypothetical protein
MHSIINVLEKRVIKEYCEGAGFVGEIEPYLIKSVIVEQDRFVLKEKRRKKTVSLPEDVEDFRQTRFMNEARIVLNQIRSYLDPDHLAVVRCLEEEYTLSETLERCGLTAHQYYKRRQQLREICELKLEKR